MKMLMIVSILAAAMTSSFCQERENGIGTKYKVTIKADKAVSYEDPAKQNVTELTKPSVTVVRRDGKEAKAKGTIVRADQGKVESKADGSLQKIKFIGNVRAEEGDGSVIHATEATIDLVEETLVLKVALR